MSSDDAVFTVRFLLGVPRHASLLDSPCGEEMLIQSPYNCIGDPKLSGHFSLGNVVLEPCNGLFPFIVSQLSLWQHDQN